MLDLMKYNLQFLNGRDVPLIGYFNAGNALVSNLVLELGGAFIDPYLEMIRPEVSKTLVLDRCNFIRYPAMVHRKEPPLKALSKVYKTHLYPNEMGDLKVKKAIVLFREPLDTIVSFYHWKRAFSRVRPKGDLHEFVRSGFRGRTNVLDDWSQFYGSWLSYLESSGADVLYLSFEALKKDSLRSVEALNEFLGTGANAVRRQEAIERSSLETMRDHEAKWNASDQTEARLTIYRKGGFGEGRKIRFEPGEKYLLESREKTMKIYQTLINRSYGHLDYRPAECR